MCFGAWDARVLRRAGSTGASGTRLSLRPPTFLRDKIFRKARARWVARLRRRVSLVSCPAQAGHPVSQRPLGSSTAASGILGRPVKPDDDSECAVGKLNPDKQA